MKRILIQNGTLYDGLGGQPYQADLLVQDDRIAQIAPGITEPADQVIDATGKVVTPGLSGYDPPSPPTQSPSTTRTLARWSWRRALPRQWQATAASA